MIHCLDFLSQGLGAVTQNAESLLGDAKLLLDEKRYSRAAFLVTTADEEMAKAYILCDMTRLDFQTQEGPLRGLSAAFYNHVAKYAYNRVVRFDSIRNLEHAREIFHLEMQRWWPSGNIESGEPDMPHNTYFLREANLYVDFDDYSKAWAAPSSEREALRFEMTVGKGWFAESSDALQRLLITRDKGLYSPGALRILNELFSKNYFTERTPEVNLPLLYAAVAEKIEAFLGIPRDVFESSALHEWPLYHFLRTVPRSKQGQE